MDQKKADELREKYPKGIFFDDDNFEHMACGIVADWGENGRTEVRICDLEDLKKREIFR